MDLEPLAQALDALIDRQRRLGSAEGRAGSVADADRVRPIEAAGSAAPAAPAAPVDPVDRREAGDPTDRADLADLAALAHLAATLDALPKAPAPEPAFRAALAARLAAAPAPAILRSAEPSDTASAPDAASPDAVTSTAPTLPATHLTHVLDASLAAMAAGRSPEAARALFGAAGDVTGADSELSDLLALAATLYELPDAPAPRASFRNTLRDALANAPEPRSLRRRARPPLLLRVGDYVWRSTKVMAAAAAAVILFAGAGVTFASANALPGDWLYPVKRTTERAQLWLDGPADAMHLHLAFADRRLDEAVARPPLAGMTLAEFNREVTAALASADEAVARRAPRETVAEPLLRWLIGARRDLLASRATLPPMAWRGARALVDEAILALDGGRPLVESLIPRLADPAAVLALRSASGQPWAQPARRAALLPAPPIVADVPLPDDGGNTNAARRPLRGLVASNEPATARTAAAAPNTGVVAAPPAGGASASRPGEPNRGGPSNPVNPNPLNPKPSPTGRPAGPSPTSPRPSATPAAQVTTAPTDAPTAAVSPAAPTEVPASPSAVAPTATTAPVDPPVATATPTEPPPMPAVVLGCDDETVEVFQTVRCTLDLQGWALPDGWDIQWTTTSVNLPNDPELVQEGGARSPVASFTPKVVLGGVNKMLVTLRAAVRGPDRQERGAGKFVLFVVPRNHGAQATPESGP